MEQMFKEKTTKKQPETVYSTVSVYRTASDDRVHIEKPKFPGESDHSRRHPGFYYGIFILNRIRQRGMVAVIKDVVNLCLGIIGFFSNRLISKPVYAQIEPTSRCNLRCRMCITNSPHHETHDLSLDTFKSILDKLPSIIFLNIQGNGEPLLNSALYEMIQYAYRRGIITFTCTNATLLNETSIKKLLTSGLCELGISLESTRKDVYEYIRRGADFDRVKRNIHQLVALRNKINPNMGIKFWVTLMNHTMDSFMELIEYAAQTGIDGLIVQQLQQKQNYSDNYSTQFSSSPQSTQVYTKKSFMNQFRTMAEKAGISLQFIEQCWWPWAGIFINSHGYVTPCCIIDDYRKYSCGNILEKNLHTIWNAPLQKELRASLRNKRKLSCCDTCSFQ